MRSARKSDWFSVVATDLFCGALCAVIILDATSPRQIAMTYGPGAVTMWFQAPDAGCASVIVAASIVSGTNRVHLTSSGSTIEDGKCGIALDIANKEDLNVESILLAKGSADLDVNFEDDERTFVRRCYTATGECK